MRKLVAHLFMSLDGVVEAPNTFLREDLYQDLDQFEAETVGGQDAVLLGRKQYEEWQPFWPGSDIQPFAGFINSVPKHVASNTLTSLDWAGATLLSGDTLAEIAKLKNQPGDAIGVHGSISLVQSLLTAGLLDELRLAVYPALAGHGRRLLTQEGDPIHLNLKSARSTPGGLQYMVYRRRA